MAPVPTCKLLQNIIYGLLKPFIYLSVPETLWLQEFRTRAAEIASQVAVKSSRDVSRPCFSSFLFLLLVLVVGNDLVTVCALFLTWHVENTGRRGKLQHAGVGGGGLQGLFTKRDVVAFCGKGSPKQFCHKVHAYLGL